MNPDEPAPAAFNLDELRLLPDWMKADAPAPPGAGRSYDERPEPSYRRDEGRRPEQRGSFGGGRGGPGQGARSSGERFSDRRPAGAGARGGGGSFGGGGGRDSRGPERRSGPPRHGGDRDRERDRGPRSPAPAPVFPARVRIEFVPDPRPLAGIAKEIRASHLAYPLFGLARMFLDRPERHLIRMSVEPPPPRAQTAAPGEPPASAPPPAPTAPAAPTTLLQLGEDGPIATDRAALERIAFDLYRDRFYVEQRVQKDPPKGNFTGVARERSTGTLLGPTNYHAYQANLRGLYESRFSRRMSFEDFRRDVEVVNDPAMVERWKEEIRTITTYVVRDTMPPEPEPIPASPASTETSIDEPATAASDDITPTSESSAPHASVEDPAPEPAAAAVEASAVPAEETPAATTAEAATEPAAPTAAPTVFETLAEARQHFRQHYFDGLVRSRRSFEIPGPVGLRLPEASLTLALQLAHEQELRYPAGLVQPLRAGLQNTGLHIFKHRKRIVYVSASRPVPFRSGGETGGAVSEGVATILETIAAQPLINRKQLAERVLARRLGPEVKVSSPPPAPAPEAAATAVMEDAPATENADATAAAPAAVMVDLAQEAINKAKAALAADLRYLVQAGHVIEFHNNTFDLPLLPKPPEPPRPAKAPPAVTTIARPPQPPPGAAQEKAPTEEITVTPVPIAERDKAPEITAAPPVEPPPENEDIFAPAAAPAEEAPMVSASHHDDGDAPVSVGDPSSMEAALVEPFDGPESLPPPPAGVVEGKDPSQALGPLPVNPGV